MSKYKCIIFDCDGVLVDTESITNRVLLEMVKPLGFIMELDQAVEEFSGKSLQTCLGIIESQIKNKLPPDFEARYREETFRSFRLEAKPIKGVAALLDRITLPYCVASSGPLAKIQLSLKTTGLLDKFSGHIFSSYEINSWKPDPGIFLHAAKTMGFKPVDCVVIEDTISGITAAKAGGFTVFAFSNAKHEPLFKTLADHTFFDMDQLYELIESD